MFLITETKDHCSYIPAPLQQNLQEMNSHVSNRNDVINTKLLSCNMICMWVIVKNTKREEEMKTQTTHLVSWFTETIPKNDTRTLHHKTFTLLLFCYCSMRTYQLGVILSVYSFSPSNVRSIQVCDKTILQNWHRQHQRIFCIFVATVKFNKWSYHVMFFFF